jgi:hypothetical protein
VKIAPQVRTGLTLLTCSPAPCRLPNVQVSEGGMPVNEHSLAVNSRNPKQFFSSGNDYNCAALQGLYASNDGGSTWNHKCMPTLANNIGQGDVVGDYDLNGVLYATGIDADTKTGIWTGVITFSKDNGVTWSAPRIAARPLFNDAVDKPWLEIDKSPSSPFANRLYISGTQFGVVASSSISVSHSADAKTWKTVAVDTPPSGFIDQFSDLAIANDGTVYVSWMRCTLSRNGTCAGTVGTPATLYLSKSVDGGDKWSKLETIAQVDLAPQGFYGLLPHTEERVFDIPGIAIDKSSGRHAGRLYVVMYNWTGSFMQVLVTHSVDGGSTWSTPVPVSPANVNHDQFMPWIAVSAAGTLAVTWLDRRNDPKNLKYQPFIAFSSNGGATFSKNQALSSTLSNPLDDGFNGNFMGDYRINTWVGKTVYAVWMDTRTGNCQDEIGGMRR